MCSLSCSSSSPKSSSEKTAVNPRLRNLQKKLTEIEHVERKMSEDTGFEPNQDQLQKLGRKARLEEQLQNALDAEAATEPATSMKETMQRSESDQENSKQRDAEKDCAHAASSARNDPNCLFDRQCSGLSTHSFDRGFDRQCSWASMSDDTDEDFEPCLALDSSLPWSRSGSPVGPSSPHSPPASHPTSPDNNSNNKSPVATVKADPQGEVAIRSPGATVKADPHGEAKISNKGPGATAKADSHGEFKIKLDKRNGQRAGLCTAIDGNAMVIKRFAGGLLAKWNDDNPNCKVEIGDRIVEVNGISGDTDEMVHECRQRKMIEMRIRPHPNSLRHYKGQANNDVGSSSDSGSPVSRKTQASIAESWCAGHISAGSCSPNRGYDVGGINAESGRFFEHQASNPHSAPIPWAFMPGMNFMPPPVHRCETEPTPQAFAASMTLEVKFCPYCGGSVKDSYGFCSHCGKTLKIAKDYASKWKWTSAGWASIDAAESNQAAEHEHEKETHEAWIGG